MTVQRSTPQASGTACAKALMLKEAVKREGRRAGWCVRATVQHEVGDGATTGQGLAGHVEETGRHLLSLRDAMEDLGMEHHG